MSQPSAIRVEGLSKAFKLYARPADLFWEALTGKARHRLFWALKDLSFDVKKGQAVGILGRNGAGKSTLLKLICGKLDPTAGEVQVVGRISSILELGTGFSPDYTGRENVRLGGLMIGMTQEEIDAKMEWIVDFSELRDFIDQPFRTYSSGMQARLTFATAICVEPEILIVDEALSVGDVKFQRKCFAKMSAFRESGRTILLVSHDLNTISTFCDHAILLEGGRIYEQGAPRHIGMVYYHLIFGDQPGASSRVEAADGALPAPTVPPTDPLPGGHVGSDAVREMARQALARRTEGSRSVATATNAHELRTGSFQEAEVLSYGILDDRGALVSMLTSGERYRLFVVALFHARVDRPMFGFVIRNKKGVDMFGVDTRAAEVVLTRHEAGDILVGSLDVTMWLTNGDYFLSAGVGHTPDGKEAYPIDFRYDGLLFSIGLAKHIQHASVVNLQHEFSWTVHTPGAAPFPDPSGPASPADPN
ncbi:MAG: ABC transporter ATP-binding protein [Vicinamibacteria bacterium]